MEDQLKFLMLVQTYVLDLAIQGSRARGLAAEVLAEAMTIPIENVPVDPDEGYMPAIWQMVEYQLQVHKPNGDRTIEPPAWTGWE